MKTCITTPVIPREGAAFNMAGLPHNTVIPREGAGSIPRIGDIATAHP